MGKFDEFKNRPLSGQGKRLFKEWVELDALTLNNKHISYIVRRKNAENLPVEYEIIYKIRSFIGVGEPYEADIHLKEKIIKKTVRPPIYGDEHKMRISLPNNYPSALGNPQLNFITDIWHPNVRFVGKFKGRVCSNEKELGIATSIATRVVRIGQYLQFKLYHAEDTYPYPEDTTVAEWVREEAEPMGWVSLQNNIQTDYSNLKEKDMSSQRKIVIQKENYMKASGKNTLRI